MDKGEVIERGTHQDLLKLGGLYANLYETQFKQ
jgi:ATP-binding cassette subfamily B protein